ncbi:GAF domain-containing protein [Lusitaniella coriacea]|uniref:GAF domain-containing protein n=1 Tax=Lusitaniella coriacea TaxID=1983105 RepID=UPI003CEF4FB0
MSDPGLRNVLSQLTLKLERDALVQNTVHQLRNSLQIDRVVLYYFYREWEGQVTCESVESRQLSILGHTGPDECFNGEYAQLYLEGRVRAVEDIKTEPISDCHRDFLQRLQVRANLAVPILKPKTLWGLLIAHSCTQPHLWSPTDIETMQAGAKTLETSKAIQKS